MYSFGKTNSVLNWRKASIWSVANHLLFETVQGLHPIFIYIFSYGIDRNNIQLVFINQRIPQKRSTSRAFLYFFLGSQRRDFSGLMVELFNQAKIYFKNIYNIIRCRMYLKFFVPKSWIVTFQLLPPNALICFRGQIFPHKIQIMSKWHFFKISNVFEMSHFSSSKCQNLFKYINYL